MSGERGKLDRVPSVQCSYGDKWLLDAFTPMPLDVLVCRVVVCTAVCAAWLCDSSSPAWCRKHNLTRSRRIKDASGNQALVGCVFHPAISSGLFASGALSRSARPTAHCAAGWPAKAGWPSSLLLPHFPNALRVHLIQSCIPRTTHALTTSQFSLRLAGCHLLLPPLSPDPFSLILTRRASHDCASASNILIRRES